jgi:hypothetical protein
MSSCYAKKGVAYFLKFRAAGRVFKCYLIITSVYSIHIPIYAP